MRLGDAYARVPRNPVVEVIRVSLFNVETQVVKARAGECCCGWCAPGALSRDCTEWIRLAAEASR